MTEAKTTQSRHPWRAVVRTVFAMIGPLAALVPLVLNEASNGNVENLGPWAVVALSASGAITRILAIPQVEEFLQKFVPWLAAEPKGE